MANTSSTSYGVPPNTFNGSTNPSLSKDDITRNLITNQVETMSSQISSATLMPAVSPPTTISSDALSSLNPSLLTANAQAKIPPLMSIRTNVSVLPQKPSPTPPMANQPLVSQGERSLTHISSVTTVSNSNLTNLLVTANKPSTTTTPLSSVTFGKPKESQGKVMEQIHSSLHTNSHGTANSGDNDSMEDDSGKFHKKVPILRLKKKLIQDDVDATFERQEVSKNDSYCWVCHDGGDVLCCDKCPRVFHIQCSGLPREPEGEEEWFCSVCKNIARKTKRSRPADLKELLLLAVSRMMFPGTEIFQSPVPSDILVHYREYVFHPLDMGAIRKKVMAGEYQSTREFTHDTEWILHNCIIYNGSKHALTKIAKGIVKVCKEDMREIELCPGCYKLTVKQPKDWFCVPCNPPHPVVLAKVRGYPIWPAKLISETSEKCDVRFFGQHDRSLVPKSSISELNGLPPKPSTKTQHWNIAMFELKKYGENIEEMREQMSGGKLPIKPIRFPKQRDPKLTTAGDHHNLNHQKDSSLGNSVSNNLPSSPAVVEVSPSSMHANRSLSSDSIPPVLSEPSSPDSPPELQIDLEGSIQGARNGGKDNQHQSPSKRMVGGGHGTLNAIERNSQVAGPLDFSGEAGPQTVTNATFTSPTSGLSKLKRGIKGRKAGDTLSQLVSSLAERKRVAKMGVVTPAQSAPIVVTSSGITTSHENIEQDQEPREDIEDPTAPAVPAVDVNPFSSVYLDRNKTAIYEVDPNQKRDRKRAKKASNDSTPPPSKKQARAKTTPHKGASLHPESNSSSPQIQLATSEVAHLPSSQSSTTDRVSSSVSPQTPAGMSVPGTIAQTRVTPSPLPNSGLVPGPKAVPSPAKSVRGPPPAGKKTKGRIRGPKASKSALAGRTATSVTPSVTPSPSVVPRSQASPVVNASLAQTRPNVSDPTSSVSGEGVFVRGEEAAPGVSGGALPMETEDFQEGSGLLADTIRKVNRSFHARLNQMAGGVSEDMGYQYFMEKLMSSVKTVLIEMLSTFDAKSRLSAKQLKEQLHTCWPVPNSRVALDQVRKELRDEMKQSLEVVRASAALELEQVVNEVKRQVEKEKEIAIIETKKKKWCSFCMNEAQYNCCWNANYCNEVCQQAHWTEHMKDCTQIQQVPPKTPSIPPGEMSLPTPMAKAPTPQLSASGFNIGGAGTPGANSGGVIMTNPEPSQPPPPPPQHSQQQQQGGYVFVNSSAAAMAAAVQAHAHAQAQVQAQSQRQSQGQGQMGGMASAAGGIPQQVMTNAQPSLNSPGNISGVPNSQQQQQQQQRLVQDPSHHSHGSPLVNVDGMHQPQQHHSMEHNTPPETSVSRMDHLPNDNILITTAAASPPNHIRSIFLNQNQQQAQQRMSSKSPVVAGMHLVGGHQGPATPGNPVHHGVTSTPIAMADNPSLGSNHPGAGQSQQNLGVGDHSHSANSGVLLHAQSPMSPIISHSDNPPSVHNYSWPYQQQVIIGNDSYAHGLPLLPAMQVNTSTSQSQAFFKQSY